MFVGSMRPGEALSVLCSAVVLPTRWRRIVVVALWRHKSLTRGRARGAHHVVFDEGLIIDVLEAHVQRLTDNDFVVGLKPHAFRRKFDAIIAELGLESLGLTPESLRAGGATERHLQSEPIADISWLLRHADLATTRHYIQSATAMFALARVPAFAAVAVETYARELRCVTFAADLRLRSLSSSAPGHAQRLPPLVARASLDATPIAPRRAPHLPARSEYFAGGVVHRARRGLVRSFLCPARSAGVLNPLTRKIVFVRPACGVRPSVCTPFPYCDFAFFHFLFGNRRNRCFSNKKCVATLRPTSYLKSADF